MSQESGKSSRCWTAWKWLEYNVKMSRVRSNDVFLISRFPCYFVIYFLAAADWGWPRLRKSFMLTEKETNLLITYQKGYSINVAWWAFVLFWLIQIIKWTMHSSQRNNLYITLMINLILAIDLLKIFFNIEENPGDLNASCSCFG